MEKCDQVNCFRYSEDRYDGCQLVAERRAYCLNHNHALFKPTYYGAEDCKVKPSIVGGNIPLPIETPASDSVSHPSHYTSRVPGIECIQVTENFCFNRGNAIKYIWRAGEKNPDKEIEDLEKAAWYINREIQRVKGEKTK